MMRDILVYLVSAGVVLVLAVQLVWWREQRRDERWFRLDDKEKR